MKTLLMAALAVALTLPLVGNASEYAATVTEYEDGGRTTTFLRAKDPVNLTGSAQQAQYYMFMLRSGIYPNVAKVEGEIDPRALQHGETDRHHVSFRFDSPGGTSFCTGSRECPSRFRQN